MGMPTQADAARPSASECRSSEATPLAGVSSYSVPVIIEEVDERDQSWEDDDAHYRVYIYRAVDQSGDKESFGTECYDLTECEVLDAIDWAQTHTGSKDLFAVALVRDLNLTGSPDRGLVWLVGADDVYAYQETLDADPVAAARLARMFARRGRRVVSPS
jgi:hypothetical protein